MTDRTSMSILLNSSKQAHAPHYANPEKNLPIVFTSSPPEQLNTTHCKPNDLDKIFSSFCFTGTSWSLWCASVLQMLCTCKSNIAFISQRSNDKSECVTKVLITIRKVCLNASNVAIIVSPIVPQLAYPFKRTDISNICLDELFNYVLSMHVDHNQGVNRNLLLFGEWLSN